MNNPNNNQGENAFSSPNSSPNSSPKPPKQSIIERFKHIHLSIDDAQANRSLKVTGLVLISLLCLFVFVKTINEIKTHGTIGEAAMAPYTITVSGHGEAMAKRDTSSLSFTSYGEGKTTSEAQTKAAESNNKAIAYLKSKGIPEKDISTQSYNTYPKYDQKVRPCIIDTSAQGAPSAPDAPVRSSEAGSGSVEPSMGVPTQTTPVAPCNSYEQIIVGYETTQIVEVKIRDIDKNPTRPGEIVDGLASTGVRVGNLSNTIDNIEALQSQARNEAVMKARMEAKRIARSLGVRLGKVVSYYDNNYGYPMAESAVMSARDAFGSTKSVPPEIPAGEGKITSDVSVTFEIR